ncbi:uncharacterized protein LOC107431626 isoform X2 [Ziziphus jujuba]|uniref:Uncharacterized protein LOC107431626 isoform X2 n=1 Tax=Ziziphus jujuba TaxID=326968 RepID=A0A6P4B7C5_ZIZJJ|nr:uncharacterized protein LOC107431626 isoform X2 [Ziziphus jujuba]
MRKVSAIVGKGRQALQDLNLLKVLQSEIRHELSANPFQNTESGSLGDFVVDWDSLQSQDVVLRRKLAAGEEVVVSALLGSFTFRREYVFPRDVLMKVCLKKPGLSSMLHFDCEISEKGSDGSDFDIHNAYYLQKSADINPSAYRGPIISHLNPQLQDALKEYLVAKGIGEGLTNFLLHHLHKKEHGQYVNWLKKLDSTVAKGSGRSSQSQEPEENLFGKYPM